PRAGWIGLCARRDARTRRRFRPDRGGGRRSCDLRGHWSEVGIREALIENSLDSILAERANQSVSDGNFPKPVDRHLLVDRAAPYKHGKAPALATELGQLSCSDLAPCFTTLQSRQIY